MHPSRRVLLAEIFASRALDPAAHHIQGRREENSAPRRKSGPCLS